jgi:hypothetical protein
MLVQLLATERKNGKVWAIYRSEDSDVNDFTTAYGWVPNVWGLDESSSVKNIVECNLVKKYFMQASNGGRSNLKHYDSIADYFADPIVKKMYMRSLSSENDILFLMNHPGDTDRLDVVYEFEHEGQHFELDDSIWDPKDSPVNDWYSEFHAVTGAILESIESYATAEEAIAAQTSTNDLFGKRYFPVAKFDLSKVKLSDALIICEEFKGHSRPLTFNGVAYVGVRSKDYQLESIESIYELGGTILKDRDWDW